LCIAQIAINKINILKSKCVTPTVYNIFKYLSQEGNTINDLRKTDCRQVRVRLEVRTAIS